MSDAAAYMNDATQKARVIDGLPDGLALRRLKKSGLSEPAQWAAALP